MRKRHWIFWLLIAGAIILAEPVYVFEDATLFWKNLDDGYNLPDGVDVVYVKGAKWWIEQIKTPGSWMDILKEVTLIPASNINLKDYFPADILKEIEEGKVKIVNFDPLIYHYPGTELYKVKVDGEWYYFFWKGDKKRILHLSQSADVLLTCPGNWQAIYTLLNEKEFSLNVKVQSRCVDSGDVYVVTGKMFKEAGQVDNRVLRFAKSAQPKNSPEVTTAFERKVYHIGEMDGLTSGSGYEVFDTFVNDLERVYEISLPVNTSTDYKKAVYTLRINNTTSNGLGFPLPDGRVIVFKDMEGTSVPIGKFKIIGAPKDGELKIIENESQEILGRMVVLKAIRTKDNKYLRSLQVILKNYKEDSVSVRLIILGRMMELVESDIDPVETSSDYVTFSIDLDPGEYKFQVSLKNSW